MTPGTGSTSAGRPAVHREGPETSAIAVVGAGAGAGAGATRVAEIAAASRIAPVRPAT